MSRAYTISQEECLQWIKRYKHSKQCAESTPFTAGSISRAMRRYGLHFEYIASGTSMRKNPRWKP